MREPSAIKLFLHQCQVAARVSKFGLQQCAHHFSVIHELASVCHRHTVRYWSGHKKRPHFGDVQFTPLIKVDAGCIKAQPVQNKPKSTTWLTVVATVAWICEYRVVGALPSPEAGDARLA